MIGAMKKTALGPAPIVGAAAVLSLSHPDSQLVEVNSKSRVMGVVVGQQVSIPALDDGLAGAFEALKERGYSGGCMAVTEYNAQGEVRTANAIAKNATIGDFDLILSFSTVSLQTIQSLSHVTAPPCFLAGRRSLRGRRRKVAKPLEPVRTDTCLNQETSLSLGQLQIGTPADGFSFKPSGRVGVRTGNISGPQSRLESA